MENSSEGSAWSNSSIPVTDVNIRPGVRRELYEYTAVARPGVERVVSPYGTGDNPLAMLQEKAESGVVGAGPVIWNENARSRAAVGAGGTSAPVRP